jgi:cytochrome c-type biogenesis protein CcmH
MMKRMMIVWLFAVGFVLISGSAFATTQMEDLENALMCKCEDKCGKVLINCDCSTSGKTRIELKKHLESGLTVQQIVQLYVDKHGESILSAPTKQGFNLTAWLMPFAAILGGGLGLRKIIQTWVRKTRSAQEAESVASANAPAKSDPEKYDRALKNELDKLEL